MHIALFGGTFDPPHLAHLQIARYLISHQLVNQVWFIPVYRHPWATALHKTQIDLTPYPHRLALINQMSETSILVKEYRHLSFTYPTITYFEKKFPEHQFSWVMGSEYLPKFHLFLNTHPQLLTKPILIYPRQGHPLKPLTPNMTPLRQAPLVTISSTQIRTLIQTQKSYESLVHPQVAIYIHTHQLYLTKK